MGKFHYPFPTRLTTIKVDYLNAGGVALSPNALAIRINRAAKVLGPTEQLGVKMDNSEDLINPSFLSFPCQCTLYADIFP